MLVNNYNFVCPYQRQLVIILAKMIKMCLKQRCRSRAVPKMSPTIPLGYNVPWREPGWLMHLQITKVFES